MSAAIVAGDLAHVWRSSSSTRRRCRRRRTGGAGGVPRLQTEVMAGQYLDLRLAARPLDGSAADPAAAIADARRSAPEVRRHGDASAATRRGGREATTRLDRAPHYGDAVGWRSSCVMTCSADGRPSSHRQSCSTYCRTALSRVLRTLARTSGDDRATVVRALASDVDEATCDLVRHIVTRCGHAEIEAEIARLVDIATTAVRDLPAEARRTCCRSSGSRRSGALIVARPVVVIGAASAVFRPRPPRRCQARGPRGRGKRSAGGRVAGSTSTATPSTPDRPCHHGRLVAACFASAGVEMAHRSALHRVTHASPASPMATSCARHGRDAMRSRSARRAARRRVLRRFCDWLERLYELGMPNFIAQLRLALGFVRTARSRSRAVAPVVRSADSRRWWGDGLATTVCAIFSFQAICAARRMRHSLHGV
jgi:hypothetical protein